MPKVNTRFTINYDQQGSGEPIILIPYLSAEHACYTFQVAEFSKHFTCYTPDLRGTGESAPSPGPYSIENLADDIAEFMDALSIPKAHIFGLSLGAGVGLWLGAKYPDKVKKLSLHSAWTKTDLFLATVLKGWQQTAKTSPSVAEAVINYITPWCLMPDVYVAQPDFIQTLTEFIRSRPAQTLESFLQQANAVLNHDVEAHLGRITAPTQITFGRYDLVTSTRYVAPLQNGIRDCEIHIFENCSHAPLLERIEEFNRTVLQFLQRRTRASAA